MSMFGLGRPQPSSQEKIAAAEQEMDLITDMFSKSVLYLSLPSHLALLWDLKECKLMEVDSNKPA
jgi:hypothetical protein